MKKTIADHHSKEKTFLILISDFFRSLKLTISLLVLIATLSIIGTFIKQNASSSEYIQRYGTGLYNVLNFFNLFDMYHSWWFSAILFLLVVNLIACSLHRLPRIWSQISHSGNKPKELEDSILKNLPYVEKLQTSDRYRSNVEGTILSYLKKGVKNPKRIETEQTITLFLEKGRFSRMGVYITHLSVLIILIGGLVGSLYGFNGFVNILEGETIDQIYLRGKDEVIVKPIDFFVRCDDFKITYYEVPHPEKHIKEYVSTLTILENGKEAFTKTIKVNQPLHYKGLAFYQSSYGTIHDVNLGIQWKNKKEKVILKATEGETVAIPNSKTQIRLLRYFPQIHTFGEGVQIGLFKPNLEPQVFWLLKNFPKMEQQKNNEFILTFEGMVAKEYKGLQVAKDPGVWIVWIGCSLMILGLIVSFFFSHQRIWIRIPKTSIGEIVLAGSTSKNRFGFEKKFSQLVEQVRSIN